MFGEVARLARLGSATAPLSNLLLRNRMVRSLLERFAGIDRRRSLPPFVRQTLRRRFRRGDLTAAGIADLARTAVDTDAGGRPSVWLMVDTFTNHHEPDVGSAAIRLIEASGHRVRLLPMPGGCCGRPQLSRGLVPRAREMAEANVALWSRLVADGSPILGLEPSCLLTLRDEYPDLVGGAESTRVAASARTVEEWLIEGPDPPVEWLAFRPPAHEDEARLLVHEHCHSRALGAGEAGRSVLSRLPSTTVVDTEAGCCGMAGSFGYEPEHHDLSMAIGADRLFPAVTALEGRGRVVAAGTSCRHQISDGTGRQARHPVEILAERLQEGGGPM